jgi:hypothetical protein
MVPLMACLSMARDLETDRRLLSSLLVLRLMGQDTKTSADNTKLKPSEFITLDFVAHVCFLKKRTKKLDSSKNHQQKQAAIMK